MPGAPLVTERPDMVGGADGKGGGVMIVVPHPPVLMLMEPLPKVTVAAAQAVPFTFTVWAWLTLATRPENTSDAVMNLRVRETMFMKIL